MPKSHPTAEQALQGLLPTLNDLPPEMNRDPAIPTPRMVPEAHALFLACEKHGDRLVAVGVQRKLIQSIPERAQAAAGALARLDNVRGRKRTTQELEQQGQQLRSDIVAGGRYALRTNDKAQSTLDLIQEGTGLDSLVQDVSLPGIAGDFFGTARGFMGAAHRRIAVAPHTVRMTEAGAAQTGCFDGGLPAAMAKYMDLYMKRILIELEESIAHDLERVAPARSRMRAQFIRMAIRQAIDRALDRDTAKAYARSPLSGEVATEDLVGWDPNNTLASPAPRRAGRKVA